jgi:hypothetical protein
MPIEIKELNIKINVNEEGKPAQTGTSKSAEKDILGDCIEQVMKVIERKKER